MATDTEQANGTARTFRLAASDLPPVTTKTTRRVYLDSGPWIEVRGGGSNAERRVIRYAFMLTTESNTATDADSALGMQDHADAIFRKFLADRVVDHNIEKDGKKLPTGADFYDAMETFDALEILGMINMGSRYVTDPKDSKNSSGG